MGNGVASRQVTSNEKIVVGATKERTGNMGNGVVIDLHKYTGHALERMITRDIDFIATEVVVRFGRQEEVRDGRIKFIFDPKAAQHASNMGLSSSVIKGARRTEVVTDAAVEKVITTFNKIQQPVKNGRSLKRDRVIAKRAERRMNRAQLNQSWDLCEEEATVVTDIHDPLHYVPAEVDVIATSDQIAA